MGTPATTSRCCAPWGIRARSIPIRGCGCLPRTSVGRSATSGGGDVTSAGVYVPPARPARCGWRPRPCARSARRWHVRSTAPGSTERPAPHPPSAVAPAFSRGSRLRPWLPPTAANPVHSRATCLQTYCLQTCAAPGAAYISAEGEMRRRAIDVPDDAFNYFLFRRWCRVRRSILRCFFFDIRFRRFLTTEPIEPHQLVRHEYSRVHSKRSRPAMLAEVYAHDAGGVATCRTAVRHITLPGSEQHIRAGQSFPSPRRFAGSRVTEKVGARPRF